jgi:predicted dehydrogenase
MKKVRFGILSTAKIGREKVIPALQKGTYCEVVALASPNQERLQQEADRLSIPVRYDSYEALLADADIDAVYIPLPNHLHVPWTLKALAANKHVLCEKPLSLTAAEALLLLEAAKQKPQLKVMEAFMYRFHPQWVKTKQLVEEGRIGELRTVQSFFSYYNVDPANIRNRKEAGGGAMMDIGCYCVSFARFLFGKEPDRIFAAIDRDAELGIDRMVSGTMDFTTGTSTFTCSTQLMPYQRVNILGTEGRIEVEIPVNAPPDKETRIEFHTKTGAEEFLFAAVDQYTLQGDEFAKAILNNTPVPTSLEDAVNNMQVIENIFQSAEEGRWINNADSITISS